MTDKERTLRTLAKSTGLPTVPHPVSNSHLEPYDARQAFTFKVTQGELKKDEVAYAADVSNTDSPDGIPYPKPSRDPECYEIEPRLGIPSKVVERYQQPGGRTIYWPVTLGFRFPDADRGTTALDVVISAHIPKLSDQDLLDYYSSESSAGLFALEYLADNHPDIPLFLGSRQQPQLKQITAEMAQQFVVDKVAPQSVLKQLLTVEPTERAQFEKLNVGLLSVAMLDLLSSSEAEANTMGKDEPIIQSKAHEHLWPALLSISFPKLAAVRNVLPTYFR